MAPFDLLLDRIDRLLLRHEEAQRRQALLEAQVAALTLERDSLRSRLGAARSRIDALLDRLPADTAEPDSHKKAAPVAGDAA
jgi:cell division protein ZapB